MVEKSARSRAPLWLPVLLFTTLVLYTDDYVIAGILPEIAADLRVTEAQTGQLVTVFSLTIAIGAPLAAVVLHRVPRRVLFVLCLLVFAAANLGASFVPGFAGLTVLRVCAALAAAAMTPAVYAYVARHAPEGRAGRYIAVVALGGTGAIAVGVPVGTWIGGAAGWRATFAVMAVAGLAALVLLLVTLPVRRGRSDAGSTGDGGADGGGGANGGGGAGRGGDAGRGSAMSLADQLRVLLRLPIALGLIANGVLMTGSMMMLTYLAPFMAEAALAGVDERAIAFGLAGAAGMLGIWAGGEATDRLGADRTLLIGISVFVATMITMWVMWFVGPVPFPAVAVVAAVWGGAAFWNTPAIQTRLFLLAGPVAPQALALSTSATYLGVAGGGVLGGIVLASTGPGPLPAVASAVGAVAGVILACAAAASRRARS